VNNTINMVWLGDAVPGWVTRTRDAWGSLNPGWRIALHHDGRGLDAEYQPLWRRARQASIRSDLLRYSILAREGGVYVDADTWPIAPLDSWLPTTGQLVTASVPGGLNNWFLAGEAGADVFGVLREMILSILPAQRLGARTLAPELLADLAVHRPDLICRLPAAWFSAGGRVVDRRLFCRLLGGGDFDGPGELKVVHYHAANSTRVPWPAC